jgi:two-component system cell cycle response regulator CpdR
MTAKILVVDPNEAFATMLRVMLEVDGGYAVEVVDSGTAALALLRRQEFDLTILDMDLAPEDLPYPQVVEQVRRVQPAMRLMLIPLTGEDLPEDARGLGIQGTLSKPFFVDDLLPNIHAVLSKQVLAPHPATSSSPSAKQAVSQAAKRFAPEAQGVLAELARETHADTVLLVSAAQPGGVLLYASTLDAGKREALAKQSVAAVQAAQATAHLLNLRDVTFEHNMFESATVRLYIMTLPGDLLLVVAGPMSVPLGTIRHNLRRARTALDNLALT